MEYKYREKVLIVAWVDLIFTILQISGVFVVGIFMFVFVTEANSKSELTDLINGTIQEPSQTQPTSEDIDSAAKIMSYIFIAFAVFSILFSTLQIFFGLKLKNSTDKECSPSDAKSKAKCWMIFSSFVIGFACLGLLLFGFMSVLGLLNAMMRAAGMYFVWNYMQELSLPLATHVQL